MLQKIRSRTYNSRLIEMFLLVHLAFVRLSTTKVPSGSIESSVASVACWTSASNWFSDSARLAPVAAAGAGTADASGRRDSTNERAVEGFMLLKMLLKNVGRGCSIKVRRLVLLSRRTGIPTYKIRRRRFSRITSGKVGHPPRNWIQYLHERF